MCPVLDNYWIAPSYQCLSNHTTCVKWPTHYILVAKFWFYWKSDVWHIQYWADTKLVVLCKHTTLFGWLFIPPLANLGSSLKGGCQASPAWLLNRNCQDTSQPYIIRAPLVWDRPQSSAFFTSTASLAPLPHCSHYWAHWSQNTAITHIPWYTVLINSTLGYVQYCVILHPELK